MKRTLKKLLSLVLSAALFIGAVPAQAFAAEKTEVYLPETSIGEDILDHDVFYLATQSAAIPENGGGVYLLRVGRGGSADSESTVLVKIADMTAKYGEDYIVRVRDERTKVENPEDNLSLMEMIEGSDFEQQTISDSDDFADMMENDPDAQAAYQEGVEAALDFLDEASGLKEKYSEENPYSEALAELYGEEQPEDTSPTEPVEAGDDSTTPAALELDVDIAPAEHEETDPAEGAGSSGDAEAAPDDVYSVDADVEAIPVEDKDADLYAGAIPAVKNGEIITIVGEDEGEDYDPVQAAANLFTGENATAQRLTTDGDMMQDLQSIANVMTNVVVGASVELTFAPGETEKYLEIVPKDNHKGDGDRMFYIILGAPSGTTTNSAASTCAFTIVDDEEQEPAVVSFSDAEYYYDGVSESVTVTVNREGAMNTVVTATVKTTGEGNAQIGRDYSQVDAELVFPFGVDHLTLDIPVRTEYLTGEGDFGLTLEPTAGCALGETADATVYIDGSYTDRLSLMEAENARAMGSGSFKLLSAGSPMLLAADNTLLDKDNLTTLRTLSAVDLAKTHWQGDSKGSTFKGVNDMEGSYRRLQYKSSGSGNAYVVYSLTEDYWTSFYLAGAAVNWWESNNGKATTNTIDIAGRANYTWNGNLASYDYKSLIYDDFKDATTKPYNANRKFGTETIYVFPHKNSIDPDKQVQGDVAGNGNSYYINYTKGPINNADHPQAIGFTTQANGEGEMLHINSITPVLRPFQINIKNADPLSYLMDDGTRSVITTGTTTDAEIVDGGTSAVFFMNDVFTVKGNAGSDVGKYGYIKELLLLDGAGGDDAASIATLATNDNSSNTSISYALTAENMETLINTISPNWKQNDTKAWFDLLRENTAFTTSDRNVNGYATYAQYNIKPVFDHVDATVTLRNPYNFPVSMTICGKEYSLAANSSMEIQAPDGISFHQGDYLAISKVESSNSSYSAAGVRYWGKYWHTSTDWDKQGTWDFIDSDALYVSGSSDDRLNFAEIVIEPNLQQTGNKIIVQVNTSDLELFNAEGLLAQQGTEEGGYTLFTYADTEHTANGRLYAITAAPKDSENYVSVWHDNVTGLDYVGNTLYFTADSDPNRNIITLRMAPVGYKLSLEGYLYYNNYNLRTKTEGNESKLPAVGAVLAAGSAGGVADEKGYIKTDGISVPNQAGYYLRYMVSINGNDMVQEIPVPVQNNGDDGCNAIVDFGPGMDRSIIDFKAPVQVDMAPGSDSDGYGYYTFTATGTDPHFFMDIAPKNNGDFRYVNIRYKNLGTADSMQVFVGITSDYSGHGAGSSNSVFNIAMDNEWHELAVDLHGALRYFSEPFYYKTNATDVKWMRLDPMAGGYGSDTSVGNQIQVDYVAFFSNWDQAKNYKHYGKAEDMTIDISSNFPMGVSPVASKIFDGISVDGTISDSAYQIQSNTYIPVVMGGTANMTVKIKASTYSFTMTGPDGIIEDTLKETPLAVQLAVYDANDVFKGTYPVVDSFKKSGSTYTFTVPLEFAESSESEQDAGTGVSLIPAPGDKLYLRLTTDRLAQTEGLWGTMDEEIVARLESGGAEIDPDLELETYQYSDVFTGKYFYQPVASKPPVQMGLKDPITITFANLPLIGGTGLNLNFPFLNVGIMKIHQGYRLYLGFSPVQIADTIKGTHLSQMSTADGKYWKSLFSIKEPLQSFSKGLSAAAERIGEVRKGAKEAAENNTAYDKGSLGSPSWRFDLAVGVYFDFINPNVTTGTESNTSYIFNGVGGYVSVTLGFSMAWYVILPIVFIPGYFNIEISGTVMGFLGADLNKSVQVSYDDSLNGRTEISDGIDRLKGSVRGLARVQVCFGIGLCGTLGVRVGGAVDVIGNWDPDDPNGEWGAYINLSVGGIIDLFLFSIPVFISFANWPFGSFEYYTDPSRWTESYTPNPDDSDPDKIIDSGSSESSGNNSGSSGQSVELYHENGDLIIVRDKVDGSGDSTWRGSDISFMGAFAPNKQKERILVDNAYEHPESQLITLSDGETLVLATIDSDRSKDVTERTTLILSTYSGGSWSRPVVVSNDGTADFQPSIAETKDGKVLVAWMSTSDTEHKIDVSSEEGILEYLNSMEVYAAFVELDANKRIKSRTEDGKLVADTEVTRISNDHYTRASGAVSSYYDSNPTVVCDMESGDAMIYYIKSGRSALGDGEITDYINPYTNDCVVCYMPFNAEADTDTDGRTVPAGWLFNNFYYSELSGNTASESFLINNFGGQRFLDGALNANNERYTIPDFTAIGYNGLSVYAYTVDTDGKNDTDADKELYLQVYDFRNHETKYKILLTDDDVSDAMPQFFRSEVNTAGSGGLSTDEDSTHTKLFWYKDGKQIVYLDITDLLKYGIDYNGKPKTGDEYTYTDQNGKTRYSYLEPCTVYTYRGDSNASMQSVDFKAVEDSSGNLYVLWTEGVTLEDGSVAREIFGTGLVSYEETDHYASSGWSKPYRITSDGLINDEMAVAMSGENLVVVHNRYKQQLCMPEPSSTITVDVEVGSGSEKKTVQREAYYNGVVDFIPLQISDMKLMAEVLEPCGSVEAENISVSTDQADETAVILVKLANNGMNVAQGYKLSLYAVDKNGEETLVGEYVSSDMLVPNKTVGSSFEYTLPADVDGLRFKAVTQEMKISGSSPVYYSNTDEYLSEALKARASYGFDNVETYQDADGFHAKFTVTNTGNAASSSDDTLSIELKGPANLAEVFTDDSELYSEKISLGIGESKDFDVDVDIKSEMLQDFSFISAMLTVGKKDGPSEIAATTYLSNMEYIYFDLTIPMNMELQDVTVAANKTAGINFSMDLGDAFCGGDNVTYAVDDLTIARISNGMVLGVAEGTTKLYATHASTGATTESTITVTPATDEPVTPDVPYVPSDDGGDETITVNVSGDEGSVAVSAKVSGNTAAITAPTDAQLAQITDKAGETGAVTIDLSSLPANVTAASIPYETVKAIDKALEDGGAGVTIKLPGSSVTFDAKAFASISEQTKGRDLKLNVDPMDESSLNAKQKEALADMNVEAVYDIYLTSNNQRITDFGGGKAGVEVTHKAKDGQKPAGFTVWYAALDGGLEKNATSATTNAVRFVATHFSNYVVAYDEKDAVGAAACDRGDTCPMTPFTDLNKSLWYHDGVHWALENGVMKGVGNNLFDPNGTTSRAMIVTMLHRMEGEPKSDYAMTFKDVEDGKWYTEAIRWAAENGIVEGYTKEKFGPTDDLTREQLATILYRYAKLKGQGFTGMWAFPLNFDDASDVSGWANEAVCWMTMNGVIQGTGDNKLSPKGNAARAQVATMLMRYTSIEQ